MESMHFCVSILGNDARTQLNYDRIWISGDAMNALVSQATAKYRFVFDETALCKPGWIQRGAPAPALVAGEAPPPVADVALKAGMGGASVGV